MSSLSESLLIFSDVHLGNDLDDRHANAPRRSASVDRDLVELLTHYRRMPPEGDRWRIVIAGDFIDFIGMTIEPEEPPQTELTAEEHRHGLGGAADHARQKLRRVAKRHADVFAALASFIADGHALTIVHGNHDIEFHWDEVKEDFRRVLLTHAHASHEHRVHEPEFFGRIEFNPWFFWRDGVAFIEHGHQYDPFCSVPLVMAPVSPLDPRRIARGFCDVLIRFVVRPTRGMRESGHEHVGIVHYLAFGARLGLSGMIKLGVRFVEAIRELFVLHRAAFTETASALKQEHDRRVAKFADATRVGMERVRALLALQVAPVTSSVRGILASLLLDRLAVAFIALWLLAAVGIVGHFYGPARLAWVVVLLGWGLAHRHLSKQRLVDPAASMTERAAHLAKLFPAAFVVMGHTHAPSTSRAGEATYINVGSWAEQESDSLRAARTHLVIHVRDTGAEAQFYAWEPAGPRRLPTWSADEPNAPGESAKPPPES